MKKGKNIKSVMAQIRDEEAKLKEEKENKSKKASEADTVADTDDKEEKINSEDIETEAEIEENPEDIYVVVEDEISDDSSKDKNNGKSGKKNNKSKTAKKDDKSDSGEAVDPDEDESLDDDLKLFAKLADFNWKIVIKGLLAVAAVAAVVLLVVFNTPKRRFERNFAKAEQLYSEGNYLEALSKYEKALSIDKSSLECKLGILCSKEAAGTEDAVETFGETLDSFENLSEEERIASRDLIIEYVLHESAVYANNEEARIDALEKGYLLTDGAMDIKRILGERVSASIETDRVNGNFDEAIALADRFADYDVIDSAALKTQLESEKAVYELKVKVLSEAYDGLKDFKELALNGEANPFEYDFSKMLSLDGSKSAEDLVSGKTSNAYIYIPSENYNEGAGNGAGLYTFGDYYQNGDHTSIPYLFYVGDFVDGLRSGYGISFMKTGEDSFSIYAGEWVNDKPEGKGTRYVKYAGTQEGGGYTRLYEGSWKNGLADGEVNLVVSLDSVEDGKFAGTFIATEGIGEVVPTESEDYVVQNLRSDRLIAVLASDSYGYAYAVTCWQKESVAIDALGINRALVAE